MVLLLCYQSPDICVHIMSLMFSVRKAKLQYDNLLYNCCYYYLLVEVVEVVLLALLLAVILVVVAAVVVVKATIAEID